MVVSLGRFVPRNVGMRIADFNRTNSSIVSQVFHRHISSEGTPKPLRTEPTAAARHFHTHQAPAIKPSIHPHRTFSTVSHDMWRQKLNRGAQRILEESKGVIHTKRGFSTQENMKMWQNTIKKDPAYLCLDHVDDLTSEKINDLISLFEKEGLIVDEIDLSVSGLTKELLQKLFSAIGKWQTTLLGFAVVNTGAFHQYKYFFKPSISDLKECENLLKTAYTRFGYYEMQQIQLNDAHFIEKLSEHILNVNDLHSVSLILKDAAGTLAKPPINPLTGEADLSPITHSIDCPILSNSIDD